MDSDDTLEAMAIARMATKEQLEPVDIPYKPYDALAHQIIGLLMKNRRLYFDEILDLFKKAYPYADLTVEDLTKVLTYMHTRYPRFAWVSFEDKLVLRPRQTKALYEYYFENLSMIPDEKQYLVVDDASNSAVGVLDEAFMAEYGKPGVKFIIRGSPWQIKQVSEDKIFVKAVDDPTGAIPSWIGEEIPVPYAVAQEVGQIRGLVEQKLRRGAKAEEVAALLTRKYPVDREAACRAIVETVEQVQKGALVPTDKRIIVEDWKEFVIVHANFGSLTNRALAQLLGHVLSEQTGYAVVVQHDPYRIFVQTMATANADAIIKLFDDLKQMPEASVKDLLTAATVKTGLFKRRVIHVARRFGAIKKWVDFGSVSLHSLMKSFEGSVLYDEALKEVFTKDLDLQQMLQVLGDLKANKIEIVRLDTGGNITPVARVGIERVSMKTDLIPSERMKLILVESAKARLLNETRTFVCTQNWDYLEMVRLNDLPDKPSCPNCGSTALGVFSREEDQIRSLADKRGEKLTKSEEKLLTQARETAELVSTYGKPAAVALAGRRVRVDDALEVLRREHSLSDRFFELVIEAERNALKRRFW
jgi:ATP-dependent Lhr-like helicase